MLSSVVAVKVRSICGEAADPSIGLLCPVLTSSPNPNADVAKLAAPTPLMRSLALLSWTIRSSPPMQVMSLQTARNRLASARAAPPSTHAPITRPTNTPELRLLMHTPVSADSVILGN